MLRDIYEILCNQHDEVRKTLQSLASATRADSDRCRAEEIRIAYEVISRNEAETDTFYNRLMGIPELEPAVERQRDAHEEANAALRELLDSEVRDEAWLEQLKSLEQVIEQQLADEEEELFPRARQYLGKDEAASLAKLYRHEQARRRVLLKAA